MDKINKYKNLIKSVGGNEKTTYDIINYRLGTKEPVRLGTKEPGKRGV